MDIVFQIHKWIERCGRFTGIIALKVNDFYCYLLSWQERKKVAGGEAPGKLLESHLFHPMEMAFLAKRVHHKKGATVDLLNRADVKIPRASSLVAYLRIPLPVMVVQ